jgi:hypothetical protein
MKPVVWLSLLSLVVASSHDAGSSASAAVALHPHHERGLKGARRTTTAAVDRRTIDSHHRELDIFKKFHKTMMLLRWKLALMKQGGASVVLENALASDYPSAMPSDSPSTAPSDVPSTAPSTAPSFAPSSLPSLIPTHLPTYKPTKKPTRIPSSTPSSAPSDAPSVPPSDVPSLGPSDVPSMIPSDTPLSTPELYADVFEASTSFTEDSEFCAAPATTGTTETADVTVLYAYKLELLPGARVLAVTRSIEALLHTILIDSLCRSSDATVVGVSPRPLDVPGGTYTTNSCAK